MIRSYIYLLLAVALVCGACSQVPADAALRAGHPEVAADLYLRGAQQGDAKAAFRLGGLLIDGRVSTQNYGSAVQWFATACDLGEIVGCHNAGYAYEYGIQGAMKDYARARALYLRAAERAIHSRSITWPACIRIATSMTTLKV